LSRMLDENEFLSPYGIRALSRYHAEHPYVFRVDGQEFRVDYLPAESDTGMFGGNSNWRGAIWMRQCAAGPSINAVLSLLRRQFQDRVPDRLRQLDESVRRRPRDCQPPDPDLSARRGGPAPGVRRRREVPDRSPLAGQSTVLRIFSRRQRRR